MEAKKKILIADDDPSYIEINKTILEANGYKVEEAYSSSQALEMLRSEEYDLLILDLMMEEKDAGFIVAYAVREDERLKSLPILMLSSAEQQTGFSFQISRDQEWMKVDDFAAKPLKPAELIQRVQKLLGAR